MIEFIIFEIWFFLGGLLVIVAWQLLSGTINFSGLLYESQVSETFSPGRVQLLVVALATASYYGLNVLQNPTELPLIPKEMLILTGGGNLVYLSGKSYSLLKSLTCKSQ